MVVIVYLLIGLGAWIAAEKENGSGKTGKYNSFLAFIILFFGWPALIGYKLYNISNK